MVLQGAFAFDDGVETLTAVADKEQTGDVGYLHTFPLAADGDYLPYFGSEDSETLRFEQPVGTVPCIRSLEVAHDEPLYGRFVVHRTV